MQITVNTHNHGRIINPSGDKYHTTLREKRLGVMLHYDDSTSDAGGANWFRDPRCQVSYNFLVFDDGSYHSIAPLSARAWHAGVCRSSSSKLAYKDANSAFIGIAAATNSKTPATPQQLLTIAGLCNDIYIENGWSFHDLWRITGHADEAWPRGRRIDPYGFEPRLVLDPKEVRQLIKDVTLV